MTQSSTVSLIGIGAMGSALASALLDGGHKVSIWNRTESKCAPLAEAGAIVADSIPDAIAASDVIIVCVADYATSDSLFRNSDVEKLLGGKILVQLSSGTPDEAAAANRWAEENNIDYLEGTISVYPRDIGTSNGIVLYAGPRKTFDKAQKVLRSLGERTHHVGEDIGLSSSLDVALVGSFWAGAQAAFLHGAAICESTGVPLNTYLEIALGHVLPVSILPALKESISAIERGDYSGDQATVDVWEAGLSHFLEVSKQSNVDSSLPENLQRLLQVTSANGLGDKDVAAIYETLRPKGPRSNTT